jgi:hypothetical protein
MQWLKKLLSPLLCFALGACARAPGAFVVQTAALDGGTLTVRSQWQPDARVLDALDHGIELPFVITLHGQGSGVTQRFERHVQLRYFPLSRQYQIRDVEDDATRSYAARALAIAAMENLRLSGFGDAVAAQWQVRIRLDRDALPGALRLPAMLQSQWHLDSGEYSWRSHRAG